VLWVIYVPSSGETFWLDRLCMMPSASTSIGSCALILVLGLVGYAAAAGRLCETGRAS
jgi:hypothetical protein